MTPTFHLTERQQLANKLLGSGQKHILLRGGSRSGKTFILVRAVVVRAIRGPGSRHAMLRLRANATRSSIWLDTLPKVMRLCFPHVRWTAHKQDGYVKLANGSEIWVGGLDDEERAEKILGQEFITIFLNEASQIPYHSVLIARTRLAQQIEGLQPREYFDCNPTGTGHYTYQLFRLGIDPETKRPVDTSQYAELHMNPVHNRENIAPGYIDALMSLPEKQRKRFFEGEWQPEVEGALWTLEVLGKSRLENPEGYNYNQLLHRDMIPALTRCVVAVDPSGATGKENERSDEIGIIVAGKGDDGKGYVLADRTCRVGPAQWGRIAVEAYRKFRADAIVAETNYGGAMVTHVIQTVDDKVPVKVVTASRGKAVRAEPIAALYEQDYVRHIAVFGELEEQMLNMSTAGYMGAKSPDRLDALVWALTDLHLAPQIDVTTEEFLF